VSGEKREAQIDDFMRHDSDNFLFLLSTRAGGLGLNLQKANWLVLSTLTGIPRLIFKPWTDAIGSDRRVL
jgi:hypothetical protein